MYNSKPSRKPRVRTTTVCQIYSVMTVAGGCEEMARDGTSIDKQTLLEVLANDSHIPGEHFAPT